MIIDHYDRAKRISAEQQHICYKILTQSRGISAELINDLASSSFIPIEDDRAIAGWSVIMLKDPLNKKMSYFQRFFIILLVF